VVLVHGMLGFRRFLWLEYFRGVRTMLLDRGLDVTVPKLPWGQPIERRARVLSAQLEHNAGPLHLIAHSMGGVDARYYITHLGGDKKVFSLTTLSAPHHGSAAADHELKLRHSPFRRLPALPDLTRQAMREFNAATPDRPDVTYRSYSASRPVREQPWLVRRFGRIIAKTEGDNDSQVSVASACWGEHMGTLAADHFELIGMNIWLNPFTHRTRFDHLPLYRQIARWIQQHHEASSSA